MSKLTQEKKGLLLKSHVDFKDRHILMLDGIGRKAFEGFKQALDKKNISLEDEEVILFKDFTWFGSGDEGLLITDEHLYFKYWWYFECVKIADVREVQHSGWFNENIKLVLNNGKSVSLWAHEVFDEVKTVVDILRTGDAVTAEPVTTQVQCLGCKAIIRSNQAFCEYCRSPLS